MSIITKLNYRQHQRQRQRQCERQARAQRLKAALIAGGVTMTLAGAALGLRQYWRRQVKVTELEVSTTQATPHELPPRAFMGASPLQLIHRGYGKLFRRSYQVDILNPELDRATLMQRIRDDINQCVAPEMACFERTSGTPGVWEVGDEFFIHITGPWNGPVRVIDVQPTSFAFATLEGHLEAGEIHFQVIDHPEVEDAVRFEIRSWARSSNIITNFFYSILGISKESQMRMWTHFCKKVVEISGGEMLGDVNVMTHRTRFDHDPDAPLWKQYEAKFDEWRSVDLNFDPNQHEQFTEVQGWFLDEYEIGLPGEPPGEPVHGGSWETAKQITMNYEFPDPTLVSGIFIPDGPLEGRLMIVRAHFWFFTFLFGVRVNQVIDEVRETPKRGPARVWGYSYQTLNGHFEMGQITFEVWKFMESGEVEFRMHAYSRPASINNIFYRLGFRLFGRSLQRRFGRTSLARMQQLVIERMTDEDQVPEDARVNIETPELQRMSSDASASQKAEEIEDQQADMSSEEV